jgi:hypothetical protein
MSAPRDVRVRVRPQFAALYPELATGAWVSAREFAQVIVARASQARRDSLHRRTLDLRHFEVRGARCRTGLNFGQSSAGNREV